MINVDLAEPATPGKSGARKGLDRLAAALRRLRPADGCFIVGITGAVASGKSTLSNALMRRLGGWPDRPRVELVGTDGFLHSNQVLGARGLTARKGFPESYDVPAMRTALRDVRSGAAVFPGYSHVIYDIDPALERRIERPDILIIEGLSLDLDRPRPAAREPLIDALIYLDADETQIEAWFVSRFLSFWEAAERDPGSFYARFRSLNRDQAASLAKTVWDQVNLPNLRQHISLARESADIVVRKRADHGIESIRVAGPL